MVRECASCLCCPSGEESNRSRREPKRACRVRQGMKGINRIFEWVGYKYVSAKETTGLLRQEAELGADVDENAGEKISRFPRAG